LAWLIRQTQASNVQVFAALSVLGIVFLVALRWRPLLAYWILVAWALVLQGSGQDFQDWMYRHRARTGSLPSIQAFCLDYSNRGDTTPIVIEKSAQAIDFPVYNVIFWTFTDPIMMGGKQEAPRVHYYIGQDRKALPVQWSDGTFTVYRADETKESRSSDKVPE